MRTLRVFFLLSAFSLIGCASHGVIVQKEARPHPFYISMGVEGMYAFILRDETGATHRQMVTPDVFGRYAIGDNFNDEQLAPLYQVTEQKAVQVGYRPMISNERVVSVSTKTRTQVVVAKSQTVTPTRSQQVASSAARQKAPHATIASVSHKVD